MVTQSRVTRQWAMRATLHGQRTLGRRRSLTCPPTRCYVCGVCPGDRRGPRVLGGSSVAERIGKYRVIAPIGRGGMGMIFRAHDPLLDRLVALKVISPEVEVTDELRARFFREAQACAKLSHPNIVTVYDMGEDEGRLFIVMELLDGEELRQLIARGTTLALEDKLSILVQMCSGLHYAHQKGVIHRDIKPGNIMVLRDGQVKILDFGIAQIQMNTVGLTRTGPSSGRCPGTCAHAMSSRRAARAPNGSGGGHSPRRW